VISFRERPLLKKLHVIDIAGPIATAAGALAGKYLAPAWAATTHLVTVFDLPMIILWESGGAVAGAILVWATTHLIARLRRVKA
jgi:hypothetical protein